MRQLLFIALMAIYLFSSAQTFTASFGPVYDVEGGKANNGALSGLTAKYYYYTDIPFVNKGELIKYDFNHKEVSRTPLQTKIDGRDCRFHKVINTRSADYLHYVGYDVNAKKSYTYLQAANSKDAKLMLDVDYKTVPALSYTTYYDYMDFEVSDDSSKVCYVYYPKEAQVPGSKTLNIVMYNDELNKEWARELKLNYELYIHRAIPTNDGKVIILADSKAEKSYRHRPQADSEYRIFIVDANDVKEVYCDFSADVPLVSPPNLLVTGKDLYYTGTYNKEYEYVSGVYACSVDINTGKLITSGYKELTPDMFFFGESKGQLKRYSGVSYMRVLSTHKFQNGTLAISIALTSGNDIDGGRTYEKALMLFDAGLKHKQNIPIPGFTYTTAYRAVKTLMLNNKLYFIHTDTDDKGPISIVTVTENGAFKTDKVTIPSKRWLRAYDTKVIDDKHILIDVRGVSTAASWPYNFGIIDIKE